MLEDVRTNKAEDGGGANPAAVALLTQQIAALQGTVRSLTAQMEILQADGVSKPESTASPKGSSEPCEPHEIEPLCDSFDADIYNNIYSIAVHEMLWPTSLLSIAQCSALLVISSGIQCLLAFAFFDANWLQTNLGQLPKYMSDIEIANFYPDSTRKGVGGDQVQMNVVATTVSLVFLGLLMRQDNISTLSTVQPLLHVLNQNWFECAKRQPWLLAWRVVSAIFLQSMWIVRALLMPSMAAVGGALALANSDAADDIVLNSVAIAFVFDVDEQLYAVLLRRIRSAYERSPLLPTPLPPPAREEGCGPFELPASKWAAPHERIVTSDAVPVRLYSLLIYACDLMIMLGTWMIVAGLHFGGLPFSIPLARGGWDGDPNFDVEFAACFYWLVGARCVIFSMAAIHAAVAGILAPIEGEGGGVQDGAPAAPPGRASRARVLMLCTQVLASVGVNIICALLAQSFYRTGFWGLMPAFVLGTAEDGSEFIDCLMQVNRNASCVNNADLGRFHSELGFYDAQMLHEEALASGAITDTWKWADVYGPWGAGVNTAGWSADPLDESYVGWEFIPRGTG